MSLKWGKFLDKKLNFGFFTSLLEQTLKPGKRGPKFKKGRVDAKDKVIEEQKEKIGKLEDIIEQKKKQIKNLKAKVNLQKIAFAVL